MKKLSSALNLISEELALVDEKMRSSVIQQAFPPLADAFSELVSSGGKRLRPALALLAAGFYPVTQAHIIALAASVETLHNATLVHDDVIDGSLLRRGNPTLNASWSRGATVLAGDYLFARAAAFAAETESVRVMSIFANTLMVICDGELRQLFAARKWQQEKDDYYQRIYAKTASLFSAATEAAAVLGATDEEQIARLRDYGYNLGMAFQIVDDILDFAGDESVMGKPAGSDLRQGTVTLPLLFYIQSHPQPAQVVSLLEESNGYAQDIDEVVNGVRNSGALEAARAEAVGFVRKAQAYLEPLPDNEYRAALFDIADFVIQRHE